MTISWTFQRRERLELLTKADTEASAFNQSKKRGARLIIFNDQTVDGTRDIYVRAGGQQRRYGMFDSRKIMTDVLIILGEPPGCIRVFSATETHFSFVWFYLA